MKTLFNLTVTFILIVVLTTFSCKKKPNPCDGDYANINVVSGVQVTFRDSATGKYLYETTGLYSLYDIDSLKIFDPMGKSLYLLYGSGQIKTSTTYINYTEVNFGNIYVAATDANAYNTEVCKNYKVQYKSNEFDTIRVCFKAKSGSCSASLFEYIKVYYKGMLLGTEYNTAGILVTVTKQ